MRRISVGASVGLLAAAVSVTAALALTRTERDALQVTTFDGRNLPSTTLDLSVLGADGKSSEVKARTDSAGKLQIGYVPWNEWRAPGAYDGSRLTLPEDALATVRQAGAQGVESRYTFGIRDGRLVDPAKYALNLASPFSLLCRSDEGLPRTLASGDRFAYEVMGDPAKLKQVLGERYVIDPHVFSLPGSIGYGVTSAAGARPQETWTGLQGLARDGRIARLELDPCWQFLPDGRLSGGPADVRSGASACIAGEREFPDKAVRLSGDFGATLSASYAQTPIADAWMLYNPLSPTPFFDPGDRPGDERPPTFVRTGADGSYRAALDDLSGPIEIGVAKGCDEHTTVAIAEGPGTRVPTVLGMTTEPRKPGEGPGTTTTTTPTPASTPPQKPLASAPREKPGDEQKICGPDVTDYVLGVLQLMQDSYKGWGEDERSRRCGSLYSLRSFNYAWDMQGFTPSDDSEPGKKPGEGGYLEHIFFQRTAPGYCAVPRWPCGPTVQFLGQCIHAQIVNYLQWGLMNQLCETQERGILANLLRSGLSDSYTGQDGMAALGEAFGGYGDMSLANKKAALTHYLQNYVRDSKESWSKLPGVDCALACDKYAPDIGKALDGWTWGFAWGAGDDNIPITERGNKLKKP